MTNKIGALKITICAAFISLFIAAFFLSPSSKISVVQISKNDSINPQNCAACHQENYESWHQTAHRKTVEKATIETVQGDFVREHILEYNGVKTEMTSDNGNFYVRIGEDNYKVAAVVGAKYIEQYVAEKDGEFYSLPIGYNLKEKRWINLNEADFVKKDADFSRHLKNWKTDCAACHRSDENNLQNDSADFGISCSACHGNAAEHIESKNSWQAKLGFKTGNKIINPRNLSSDASMSVCAGCHARDLNEIRSFETNELVSAHRQTDFNTEKTWANGSNKFSGNEYQAIVRSVCYVQSKSGGHGIAGEKISCASCHSQHEPNAENVIAEKSYDQNCVQCHAQFSDDAAIVEHTKHPLNSEAGNCASCHQPETVYGRMRFTRTHEISVPNPVLTVEKQIPNACNLCHTDESANWAITSSKKLWAERFRDAEISTDRQFDQPESVRALSSDDAFLRALAADSLYKHSDLNRSAIFLNEAYQAEKFPLVNYFLANALKTENASFQILPNK